MRYVRKLKRMLENKLLSYIIPENFYFSYRGYCPCCNKNVVFSAKDNWLRDYFFCSNCFSIPRERALMIIIEKYYPNWRKLSIHESSPAKRGASMKLKVQCADYIPTQYFPGQLLGTIINGYRNEDLERLTFDDESFDIIVTQDVMEHVYNPGRAFSELARTLKKGGAHIFTVPLVNKHKNTEVWAKRGDNGEPLFLKEPEYHGNPIDSKGSPVTTHWGFDIVNFIREESGLETIIEYIDDLNYGVRAEYIEVLVSLK